MSHLKRQKVPKKWPIERKGSTYVTKPNFNTEEGLPILIILRDILKVGQNKKEIKRIIHQRKILINSKIVKDEKNNMLLFDVLNILPTNKYYRLILSDKGKFHLDEIKENEANKKIAKIINKTILKGKKVQLNLSDGRNFLSDIKCKVNDSVLINLKERKIEKCLPLKEKAKVIIFAGKHTGVNGEIITFNLEEKTAKIKSENKESNILIKQLMVIE